MKKTYSKKEMTFYLLGLMGQNILYYIVMSAFSYNLQSILYFPAMVTSAILLIGQIMDGINDPIFGNIVDNTNTKFGKCRPYLLFCTPLISIFTILMFLNGTYSQQNDNFKNFIIIIWATIAYIIWGIIYSLCDVPIWSLPNLMTEIESDRSRLLGKARIVSTLGVGVSLLIIPVSQIISRKLDLKLHNKELSLRYGLLFMIITLTIIGGSLLQLTGIFTKEHIKTNNKKSKLKTSLLMLWNCKPYRIIMISRLISSISATMDIVSVTLYSYYYGNNGQYNYLIYLILFSVSTFVGLYFSNIFIPKIIGKYEKSTINNIGSIFCGIFCIIYFIVFLIAPSKLDSPIYVLILCIINIFIGFGNGSKQLIQSIMIADCVDYEEFYNGYRPDGIFTSGQLIVTKISSGIGALINGIVFSIVGFSSSNVEEVNNLLFNGYSFKSDSIFYNYKFAMFFLFTIPPALGFLLSVLPMKKYPLNNKKYSIINNELSRRRKMEKSKTIFNELQDYLSKKLSIPKEKITPESLLVQDIGMNSLSLIQIIGELENTFNIIIEDDDIYNLKTVNDIVIFLSEKRS